MVRTALKHLAVVFFLIPLAAFAQDYPKHISSYVNDFADLIDPETETRITNTLAELRKDTGIEMTVVTIKSVQDYNSTQSVPDFTTGLFNKWGVGDKQKKNGIVFLTSVNDREMFIGLGSGYPPAYDDRMDRVFDYHVKPYFVKNQYSKGIEVGVLETIKRTSTHYVEPKTEFNLMGSLVKIFVFGFFAFVILKILWEKLGVKILDVSYTFRRCPNCKTRNLSRSRIRVKEPTYIVQGKGLIRVECSSCSYQNESVIPIAAKELHDNDPDSGGSSGGGGSFGGGSSSGGGGGGRW